MSRAFTEVAVATCDREIASEVGRSGGRVIMTSPNHVSASDRVAEAMRHLVCTHVVNVQGDEILVLPVDLARMVRAITAEPEMSAWNALGQIEDSGQLKDPSLVKCVISRSGRVLFCARDFSTLIGKDGGFEPVRIVLGILAYNRSFLEKYSLLQRTPLELLESIDQSRILEHDITLQGVEFSRGYPGINEPREVRLVERYLSEDPLQREVLDQILG